MGCTLEQIRLKEHACPILNHNRRHLPHTSVAPVYPITSILHVEANDECGPQGGTCYQTLRADSVGFGTRANVRVLTRE